MFTQYVNEIFDACEKHNHGCRMLFNDDIEITTTLEKWIVHIVNKTNDGVRIKLYHRNNLFFRKSRKRPNAGGYPDYHIQFDKVISARHVVGYVSRHEVKKWGVRPNSTKHLTAVG